ncbi:hypothetical protein V2J09_009078 [Rumex salicifolius]
MAPPTPSKSNHTHHNQIRTPSSKNRAHLNSHKLRKASPNPNSALAKENPNSSLDHPIEVIGRIRDLPPPKDETANGTAFHINPDRHSIRVRTEIGYRDFSLDGVSSSEEDDLEGFYKKYIQSRILGVKMGAKCTIMMYGPTGSGKSHTMFGCLKQPGIVYRSLKDILGEFSAESEQEGKLGVFVNVTVLEIYNEEIYDLLSCEKGGGGFSLWSKGGASKVRLEIMGKKAKNATFISGSDAGKISKEIQKVEKRRIIKSTNCNDRSSRSHCMIILDAPTVGGRLMLVDMAGSENIEQAGQIGFEAKMQTAKINQGNTALKRVVESIANGDSHVPFRDSKLTMLLQDSFEDDKSKILMILCACPDPKEMHKTISTLEYGAKAKCIVRGPHTAIKDTNEDSSSTVIMGSRITAMDQFIMRLEMENKQREKEQNEAHKLLRRKEEEVAQLRAKLEQVEVKGLGLATCEEEINEKVNERTQMLRQEMEKQIKEAQRMAQELVEMERRRMEEKIFHQQQEVELLRRRLEEMELELTRSRDGSSSEGSGPELDGTTGLARRLKELYSDDDPSMIKSMDLDMGDQETYGKEVKIVGGNSYFVVPSLPERMCLSTVYEDEELEEDDEKPSKPEDEEVEKEVIEEKRVLNNTGSSVRLDENLDTAASRKMRIQNIFTLCGNHRELNQAITATSPAKDDLLESEWTNTDFTVDTDSSCVVLTESVNELKPVISPTVKSVTPPNQKENMKPGGKADDEISLGGSLEVYVKWEATKENPGKLISKLKVAKDASLADLRKMVEISLGGAAQDFVFLSLGDASGLPVAREKEGTVAATTLPACNSQLGGHLACLRLSSSSSTRMSSIFSAVQQQQQHVMPFNSLENKLPMTAV